MTRVRSSPKHFDPQTDGANDSTRLGVKRPITKKTAKKVEVKVKKEVKEVKSKEKKVKEVKPKEKKVIEAQKEKAKKVMVSGCYGATTTPEALSSSWPPLTAVW
jgi:hypothetical protein